MLLGGIFFLTGSIMYLPSISGIECLIFGTISNLGTWIFRIGSCCYFTGSLIPFIVLINGK